MKRRIWCLCLILIVAANCFAQEDKIWKIFDNSSIERVKNKHEAFGKVYAIKGAEQFKRKEYVEARASYIDALLLTVNPAWYFELGDVLYELKEYTNSAVSYLNAANQGYEKRDLAYYNAACSTCLSGDAENGLTYVSLALIYGYPYKSQILSDTDLNLIRSRAEFQTMLAQFFPVETILKTTPFNVPGKDVKGYSINDFDNNGTVELAVLHVFPARFGAQGSYYYMALYKDEGHKWTLVNWHTLSGESVPETETDYWVRKQMDLKYPEDTKTLSLVMYEKFGKIAIVIPSRGSSYYGLKIFGIVNGKIRELGEVGGFEKLYSFDGDTAFVGHYVTDSATLDGTSKTYYWYSIMNGALVKHDGLPGSIYEDLRNQKWNDLVMDKDVHRLSELFWFVYMNKRSDISGGEVNRMARLVSDGDLSKKEITAAYLDLVR